MTNIERTISVTIGVAGVIWAFLPGVSFYPGGLGISDPTKPIPKWFGRLWFSALGFWFIYGGLTGGVPLLAEKVVAVGIGLTIIIAGVATKKSHTDAASMTERGNAPSVPKRFGGLLFLVVGLLFILGGLALKR